ncbi:MAG: prepilin-type N-terminal cleavage/methylation domain-containing protein [Clostridia bacterium]|nr:prepilin-type N-terminal cleavage/methylation domain-containing protein [Clostridia bacterium]
MRRLFAQLHKKRDGFTLVELIVVICVLAILAGIAVPAYSGYIKEARKASDLVLLEAVNKAFAAACLEQGIDVRDVKNVLILLDGQQVDNIQAILLKNGVFVDEATIDLIQAAFDRYFAENSGASFEQAASILSWDEEKMVFVLDGWRITAQGNETNSALVASFLRSSFWTKGGSGAGVGGILQAVDGLTASLGQMSPVTVGRQYVALKEIMKDPNLMAFMTNTMGMTQAEAIALRDSLTGENTTAENYQRASAISVLYTAHQMQGMSVADALACSERNTSSGMAQSLVDDTARYALLLGFAYNHKDFEVSTYDRQGNDLGRTVNLYEYMTSGNRISGSYLQAWFSEAGVTSSAEYQAYMASDQMRQDLNAFLGMMQIMDRNSEQFDEYFEAYQNDPGSKPYEFFATQLEGPFLDVLGISGGN